MIVFQNRTTAGNSSVVTATEDTVYQITVSGDFDGADVRIMLSSDSLRPAPLINFVEPGGLGLSLKAGSSWYVAISDVGPDTDIDVTYL